MRLTRSEKELLPDRAETMPRHWDPVAHGLDPLYVPVHTVPWSAMQNQPPPLRPGEAAVASFRVNIWMLSPILTILLGLLAGGAALFAAMLAPLTTRLVDKAAFNNLDPNGIRNQVEERMLHGMLVWLINHPTHGAGLPAGVKPVGGGRMEHNAPQCHAHLDFKWTTPAAAGLQTVIPNEQAE